MKKSVILFGIFCLLLGLAVIAEENDFCADTYKRVLKGEKNFAGAELEGANFKGMNLSNVNFTGADLDRSNFENANLENANFEKADLDEVNLKGANIKGANFKKAELEYAIWVDGRVCAEGSVGGCW